MRNIFSRKELALAVACALALGVFSETVLAQPATDISQHALLVDSRGAPVLSGFGTCVRSGFGSAPQWIDKCHGERPAPVAQAVAPVAMPEPAPAPIVVAAAVPLPVYEKVVIDTDVLFDSGSSALRPAGRNALDQFVASIHGLESRSIAAVGYADRMGSEASNQILSEQRVDAVKAYLVGKGITTERVETSARGETAPTTSAGDCRDASNAKNIACLQSDRHVHVTVSGTRIAK
jgi:OOP family OmpA-OmpF porin